MTKQLSAGSIIDARCTRCSAITNHTIVAMVGDKVVRVECNTCHGIHNYHPIKAVREPAAAKGGERRVASPRAPKVDPAAAAASEWTSLLGARDLAAAVPYDMHGSYRVDALLQHPKFGVGIVRLVLPGKVEVLFQEGLKRLICG